MSFIFEQKILRSHYTTIFLLAAFISNALPPAAKACPLELPLMTVFINGHSLIVEVAFTPASRSCGLSNRVRLDEGHGMLFVFPNAKPRKFWMKDTRMPLSAAFMDDSGKIINIEKMEPNKTKTRYFSQKPAVYVLETNPGWFESHGIQPGDTVAFELLPMLNIQ